MGQNGRGLEVVYEDNHLLAVNKPAMLPTMGVAGEHDSLLTVAKEYIRNKYSKPGNVYLGIVSRLDAPVTGLVLLAKTSKAASRLSEAFRLRRVQKTYLAVVEGKPAPSAATLEHHLRKDERHRKVHVTHAAHGEAQLARLTYQSASTADDMTLLEVKPETGRKHQIRVQLAKTGYSIIGDRKYGSTLGFPDGIALHSYRLELEHPVRHEALALKAPVPPSWRRHQTISQLISQM
jgi:23S rRNA pseudouridine1911/1915/1917 synthase